LDSLELHREPGHETQEHGVLALELRHLGDGGLPDDPLAKLGPHGLGGRAVLVRGLVHGNSLVLDADEHCSFKSEAMRR
jgi:hypothetical protein